MPRRTIQWIATAGLLTTVAACAGIDPQASAPAPATTEGWIRYEGNPVLRVPADRAIAADPSILFDPTSGRYRLWFAHVSAHPRGVPAARIGYAESVDGFRWEKLAFDVVALGRRGAWDERHVETPHVLRDERESDPARRYKLWYSGLSWDQQYRIGLAVSSDGTRWGKLPADQSPYRQEGLVLDLARGDIAVSDPTVVLRDGVYHLWFSMLKTDARGAVDGGIGHATSRDGIRWDRHPNSPVVRASGWDAAWGVEGAPGIPFVLWNGRQFELWYNAGIFPKDIKGDPAKQTIGYATSDDGIHWRKLDRPILVPNRALPSEANGFMPGVAAIYQGQRTLLYYPGISGERVHLNLAIRAR